jgi:glycosyltransferase involved in cell wall biosynthesis
MRSDDEIVIQVDSSKVTIEVIEVAEEYVSMSSRIKLVKYPLNRDFASFKNNAYKQCTKNYIFQIDADEYPSDILIQNIHEILELNPSVELFLIPRINTVSGLTEEHIQKWGWRVNEKGWVNYPDHQQRIFKNIDRIKWVNKVHERIVGARTTEPFPDGFNLNLIHPKTIERQEKQNNFYNTL